MKKNRSMFRSLLVVILIFSFPLTTFAAGKQAQKEEVVYGILKNDGTSEQVYIVNIFDRQGQLVDYGDYSQVRNMTSENGISMDGNKISLENTDDKLYYEGVLKENELPWNISIRYFLDGEELSAEEVAGKSGNLEIKLKIDENKRVDPFFFKNYAIQTTLVLDTEKAENIKAEEATIANVGRDKHLTYTILPGKAADISVEASVEDFEMEAIAINGINLNLVIDIDDAILMERVEELLNGVNKLDQAAEDVKKGSLLIKDASTELGTGTGKLGKGTSDVDKGVASLKSGIEEMGGALASLDSNSNNLVGGSAQFKAILKQLEISLDEISIELTKIEELSQASSDIKTAIGEVNYNLKTLDENVGYDQYKAAAKNKGLDIDGLRLGNDQAINTLNNSIGELKKSLNEIRDNPEIPGSKELSQEIENQIADLTNILELLHGNNAAIAGSQVYIDEISSSIGKLYEGSRGLNKSYQEFDQAISDLLGTLNKMAAKLPGLTEAVDGLVQEYSKFDEGVNDYTDGVARVLVGHKGIIDGARDLNEGTSSLKSASLTLDQRMMEFLRGTEDLYDGTVELAQGTGEFKDRTSNIDETLEKEIDELLLELTGDASKTVSFASSENKNVESVQFIIKTRNIEVEEVEELEEEKIEDLSFWEKVKDLFN